MRQIKHQEEHGIIRAAKELLQNVRTKHCYYILGSKVCYISVPLYSKSYDNGYARSL
jgi:hypothetical protein